MYRPTLPESLYNIRKPGKPDLTVSISAVVGKNGSGKSSLLELLFVTIYLISVTEDVLPVTPKSLKEDLARLESKFTDGEMTKDDYERDKLKINFKLNEIAFINDSLKVEIFYSLNNSVYCIRIRKENGSDDNGIVIYEVNKDRPANIGTQKLDFSQLFYTIAVNYSIYGLNSLQMGDWIADLFHKNDGYQSPIVINPFRDEGNININLEHDLAQTRLLANLVNDKMEIKTVLSKKTVSEIHFALNPEKVKTIAFYNLQETIDRFSKKIGKTEDEIFAFIYKTILQVDIGDIKLKKSSVPHFTEILKYTIRKVFKIATTYHEYNGYVVSDDRRISGSSASPFPSLDEFEEYLSKLKEDKSHITLKLRQILNTVRFNTLSDNIGKGIAWKSFQFELTIDEFAERIRDIIESHPELEIAEIIPVAFFNPNIFVKDESALPMSPATGFTFLSSGELQFVHTIQSILYHILNLDSVFESNNDTKSVFESVNIILDEIELYFHPDFQRNYVAELLKGIDLLALKNIKGINITFSTHSPFILSDIPNTNILRVNNGSPLSYSVSEQTLGANIHDLLANDFFMKESYMGEWIKNKIISAIDFLESKIKKEEEFGIDNNIWSKKTIVAFIDIVGEPLIKNALKDMYEQAFPESGGTE
jgi:hypothetical protein